MLTFKYHTGNIIEVHDKFQQIGYIDEGFFHTSPIFIDVYLDLSAKDLQAIIDKIKEQKGEN